MCQRYITVYLGEVEWVEVPLLRLLEGHDLDVHGPGGMVPGGDGVVEVADGVVGVLLGHLQYSTVQYSTVQYSTVQYSTVQYSTVQGLRVPGRLLHTVDVAGDGVQRSAQRYLHIAALTSGGSNIPTLVMNKENDATLS